ncbi:hypothetical protein [Umezakia ovalisporum]|jgi:hypothetical protein|uniref:Uncharacterized protein n=1 Tax=Umezakia ovalisporum FSS-62 TaxID=2971776 RepID=A0AA43KG29_9CYAN|nr:hypothetical protein [Umezakia ovalisporum]MBI1240569.1 hypothetical protein [Nostoc sp. RI_552]MDH6065246.1 hypothetical protein [Umezakia ovalisporum FSS-62]MDH6086032.1 hypothetical protein [Umezakia ovalisporum TAC611]MDH6088254.1 hypothetical protein [Umezakia ovalisporum Ak1311]CEJ46289.1 Uncharacterized protein apha_02421 [Umezakia ovalisporum]
MLRVYHLFLGVILLALTPVGVKTLLPRFSGEVVENQSPGATATQSKSPQTTPAITPTPKEGNTWNKILGNTPIPNGWEVIPCEGNAPLLCISSQGELLGTVEIAIYPLKNNPKFQKNLTDAGIPVGSQVDYQSPEYQQKLLTALKAWVADLNASFAQDRRTSYGNTILFSSHPPQQVPVGKLQGIRYGFIGIKPEGGVEEQHITHVTFDGEAMYVIATAFDPGSITGKFDQLEDLAIFQPYLSAIIADLKLPKN